MTDATIRELADWTGFSVISLRNRLANLPTKPGKRNAGLYDSRDALRLIYVSEANPDDLDLSQERARLAKAQADITEMQREELKGVLVRAEEVLGYWQQVLSNARLQLLGLPRRIGHLVLGVSSLGEVEGVILTEVETTLNELADFVPIPAHPDPANLEAAATPDDEPMGGRASAAVVGDKRRTRKVADQPRAVPAGDDGRRRRSRHRVDRPDDLQPGRQN